MQFMIHGMGERWKWRQWNRDAGADGWMRKEGREMTEAEENEDFENYRFGAMILPRRISP
jgi:hypothetical protein